MMIFIPVFFCKLNVLINHNGQIDPLISFILLSTKMINYFILDFYIFYNLILWIIFDNLLFFDAGAVRNNFINGEKN
jgi:hypothetical protein